MTHREVMDEAIKRYGSGRQLVKCCEELAELQQAICKLFDGATWNDYDIESVVEEIADVEIMLEQVRMVLAIDPELEASWRDRKLRRLRLRMKREEMRV